MSWTAIIPEIIIAATALVIVLLDIIGHRRQLPMAISISGILIAVFFTLTADYSTPNHVFNGLLTIDGWSFALRITLLLATAGVILASTDYYVKLKHSWSEYHAIVLFALTGMMFMPSASDLISAFISMEVTIISFCILAGFLKDSRSSEASIKMMLIGGIASAITLYGMAFIFGSTGATNLAGVASGITSAPDISYGLMLGILLLVAGFCFEIAAIPFHMWAPDTYEGSPTPVTLYLSAASKIAGMALIVRVFVTAFTNPMSLSADWGVIFAAISAITMTLGNLLALQQTNIKRMLAYSGIAHTGYLLIGIAVLGASQGIDGQSSLLFYLVAFALAETAVFAPIIVISRHLKSEVILDFAGIGQRSPFMGLVLSLGLISLIGLPPTAGFMAKLYIFTSAADNDLLWLIIIAVLNTVISAYYYLKVIKIMWLNEPAEKTKISMPFMPGLPITITAIGLLLLGIAPYLLIKLAERSLIILP